MALTKEAARDGTCLDYESAGHAVADGTQCGCRIDGIAGYRRDLASNGMMPVAGRVSNITASGARNGRRLLAEYRIGSMYGSPYRSFILPPGQHRGPSRDAFRKRMTAGPGSS